jgi:O-acetyl-ADP-ribose deacetylase (regulator of RNase III)
MFADDFVEAFGHGVNAQGIAGKGVVIQVKNRYPYAIQKYQSACKAGLIKPGKVQIVKCDDVSHKSTYRYVVNMCTQAKIKRGKSGGAKKGWLGECIDKLLMKEAEGELPFKSIAMPKICCSLGGLNWDEIRPFIVEKFKPSKLVVVLYE